MILKSFILISILMMCSRDRLITSLQIPGIGDIQTMSNYANDAIGVLNGELPLETLLTGSTGPTIDKILDAVGGIANSLDDFGDKFSAQLDAQAERVDERFDEVNGKLDEILFDLPLEGRAYTLTHELHSYMIRVDNLYAKYERYLENREEFNNYTIRKFIDATTSDKRGDLDDILARMFALLIPERSSTKDADGIFDILTKQVMGATRNRLCGTHYSAQMTLYQVYEAIMITETRGFIMAIFSYSLLAVYERSPFYKELEFLRDQLIMRCDRYLKFTSQSMKGLPQIIELCDAPTYVEGTTFIRSDSRSDETTGPSFSLRPQFADIKNNMVVTGIRFMKKNTRLIEYQIQQAKLLPQGIVDNRNQSWVDTPDLSLTVDHLVGSTYKYENGTEVPLEIAIPLGSWLQAIVMDDLLLPHNYVLAGVSLRLGRRHFYLSIFGVKFDYSTGQVYPDDTMWKNSKYEYNPKNYESNEWPEIRLPTDARENPVISNPKDIIPLGVSTDGDEKPLVPYYDARVVDVGGMSFALAGIGLYHRGLPKYGGYFNFRLLAIDLSEYIKY